MSKLSVEQLLAPVISAVVALVGLTFGWVAVIDLYKAHHSDSWPQVEGRVVSSKAVCGCSKGGGSMPFRVELDLSTHAA
jgi:hypothetical protein